jgi:hypothetical protein
VSEVEDRLFGPEALTPSQWNDLYAHRPQHLDPGVVRLMARLLEDALGCILRGETAKSKQARELAHEARLWVASRSPRPFSFDTVCEALGMDPHVARERILFRKFTRPTRHINIAGHVALRPVVRPGLPRKGLDLGGRSLS